MKKQQVTLKLSPQKFRGILQAGYTVDQVFLLNLVIQGLDISALSEMKERAMLQSLLRKGLITDKYEMGPEGAKLMEYLLSPDKEKLELPKLVLKDDPFEEWWRTYPGTDSIIKDKKIIFRGSRSLRNDKDKCRERYNKIVISQEYSPQQLLSCLQYEIDQKVKKSIKEHKNYMTYMKNSHAYLTQRAFEAFIDEINIKEDLPSTNTGIVGI